MKGAAGVQGKQAQLITSNTSRKYILLHTLRSAFASKSERVFWPKIVRRLHFKWFIAEKPRPHFAVEGVEVSIKSSEIRQSLTSSGLEAKEVREYIIWADSFVAH